MDRWTHVATTWDGAAMRLSVDAIEVASMPLTGNAATSSGALRMGATVSGRVVCWADRCGRVYARALSAEQIAADRDTTVDSNADAAAPTVTGSATPAGNDAGWRRSATSVTLRATDDAAGSGVRSITYRATDAQPIASTEVAGGTVVIPITSDGVMTLSYIAIDVVGNTSAERNMVVKFDATAPTVRCDDPDGAWHGANATLVCTAAETGSGLTDAANAMFALTTSVSAGSETVDAKTDSRGVCDLADNCSDAPPICSNKVDRPACPAGVPTAPDPQQPRC